MLRAGRQGHSAYVLKSSYRFFQCFSSVGSVAGSRDWRVSRQQQPMGRAFQPSSRKMQMLKADEHSFFWGQPARVTKAAGPIQGPSMGLPSCPDGAGTNTGPETHLNHVNAAAEAAATVRAPRVVVVPVTAARFHKIVGAMTVSELMQELLEVLAEGSSNGNNCRSQMVVREGTGNALLYQDCFLEAAILPPQVVEVALAKTAAWALDVGVQAGSDPDAVRLTMELLQHSLRLSRLQGYTLDDVSSLLWSLASVLGEYGWGPADGTVEVVQSWLGGSETVAILEGGTEAARFSVLASLLWGYAALLQTGRTGTAPASGNTSNAVAAEDVSSSSGVYVKQQAAGRGLDMLARRAAELIRAYDKSEPVAAVELADVAWAVSIIRHRSPAFAQLAEAVAHEVFRQLSNRSSINTPFEPSDLVKVVRAFADMGLDGFDAGSTAVPRMLDAIGGHVAKHIHKRRVGAITRPSDCVELLRGFADTGHSTVVVPELLKAVAMQVSREVATHNIAAPRLIGDVVSNINSTTMSSSSTSCTALFVLSMDALPHHVQQESRRDGLDEDLWHTSKQQSYWHWSSFLDSAQVISILSSYIRLGHYPGVQLLDSLLLAIQPQLLYMSSGEVSELLQLLAAARHVPGPQTLNLLASAAFEYLGNVPAGNLPLGDSSQPDRQGQGRAACPLQQLASLWALVMMGWRPEPVEVEQVLVSVMLDDSLQMDIQDVGRVMSLLCVLPHNELTVQRFGLAAMKLRDALAVKSSALLDMARKHGSISSAGYLGTPLMRKCDDMEIILRQQLLPTLMASGVAMTLLGAEGWEMAEQVLPPSHFQLVEATLRRVQQIPYDYLDRSYIEDTIRGLRHISCSAGVQTFSIPVDALRPLLEGKRITINMDQLGSS